LLVTITVILSEKHIEQKINATAALNNSQKRAMNLDANVNYEADVKANETTTDLKFCSVYGYRGNHNC
jgi:hypothetical protein